MTGCAYTSTWASATATDARAPKNETGNAKRMPVTGSGAVNVHRGASRGLVRAAHALAHEKGAVEF